LLNEIIREQGITAGKIQQVIKEIDKIDKLPEKQLQTNLKKYGAEKILSIFKKPKRYFEKFISYKEIQQLEKYCKLYGVKIEFLPSLARGLSYYTGNVFEIKTNNLKETIAAGGTYLIDSLQCTGISLGLERVASLVKMKVAGEKILIVSIGQDEKAIKLAEKLRDEKIAVQIWSEKGISKALEYANSLQIPYVIFFGEEEFKLKKFKLRNMSSGKEKMLSETELIKELKG
jgi:histidyl-tRNA synthetase